MAESILVSRLFKCLNNNMTYARNVTIGIDWSMNSPSICIHTGNEWSIEQCRFHYFNGRKKSIVKTNLIHGYPIPIYNDHDPFSRWEENASWAGHRLAMYDVTSLNAIAIEGYSYGSRGGMAFDIAENTAVLKKELRLLFPKFPLGIFSPSQIKKFASTKGNADKILMHESFVKETNVDLTQSIDIKPGSNPISDIIDSYYIAKLAFYEKTK